MVWAFALCHDDTKQDPVVYGEEFDAVFLATVHVLHAFRRVLRESATFGW